MIAREKTSIASFGDFVKVVVDIEKKILSCGCELHIDCAEELIIDGSISKNLWGANVFRKKNTIQFVSLINIRPQEGNRTMEIQLPDIRQKVEQVIREFIL